LTQEQILKLQDKAQSIEELNAVTEIGLKTQRQRLKAAIDRFRESSDKFVDVANFIAGKIQEINVARPGVATPALDILLDKYGGILKELHEKDAMRKTFAPDEEPAVEDDEVRIAPAPNPQPLPLADRPEPPLRAPKPIDSKAFEELADEYVTFFVRSQIRQGRANIVKKMVERALAGKGRYLDVGSDLGIPWWFIAGVHMLESTFNPNTHLHNGDSLRSRTVRVPKGRPVQGNPPFTWEESARDALRRQKLADLSDWSLPRALWRWERYNGFGYRSRGVPTPYLWSFSTIYEKGKFVRDGQFSFDAVSEQCGAAVLLRALHAAGEVRDINVDLVAEDESQQPDAGVDISDTLDLNLPNIDNDIPAGSGFEDFFARQFPDIEHFAWHELLVKGASHATNHLNTDPPEELWSSVIPLVRTLEAFRKEMGKAVVLTSVYRSPAYNAAIGGASRSQHMAFTAADLQVSGGGNTGAWAQVLKRLRQQGLFEGGIGIYNSFVHVDVRGTRADWDNR
jgi:lysozyme family protein